MGNVYSVIVTVYFFMREPALEYWLFYLRMCVYAVRLSLYFIKGYLT